MTTKQSMEFDQYIQLRNTIRDTNSYIWELLNEKIDKLIEIIEDMNPEIIKDIKKAHE